MVPDPQYVCQSPQALLFGGGVALVVLLLAGVLEARTRLMEVKQSQERS